MEPTGASIDLSFGQFQDGANLTSVAASFPIFFNAEVYGRYTKLNSDYQEEVGTSIYIQSDPYAKFTVGMGYETGNRDDSYEVEDLVALIGTNISDWYLEANIIRGDVVTTPFGLDPELTKALRQSGFLDATRTAVGLSAAYFASSWALSIGYRDYELNRDSEPSADNINPVLQGLRNERTDERVRLGEGISYRTQIWSDMSAANQNYYRQVSHIADQEANADFYFQYQQYSFATGLYWYESERFNEQVSSLYGSLDYPISNNLSIALLLSSSDQEASFYSELGLGIHW
ncbi:hypothetical protein SAMN02745866_00426 [Alteromonadaceae bacterium Bs31]|nr:hypothetical protein SAMN02745866_00426 [Alteromonadaceae bacterium Bs31]